MKNWINPEEQMHAHNCLHLNLRSRYVRNWHKWDKEGDTNKRIGFQNPRLTLSISGLFSLTSWALLSQKLNWFLRINIFLCSSYNMLRIVYHSYARCLDCLHLYCRNTTNVGALKADDYKYHIALKKLTIKIAYS